MDGAIVPHIRIASMRRVQVDEMRSDPVRIRPDAQ
jgi:hypothetical protein